MGAVDGCGSEADLPLTAGAVSDCAGLSRNSKTLRLRGKDSRSTVKELPLLGGRSQQMICNVSSVWGFYKSLDVAVILPFSPGSQERPGSVKT